MTKFVDTVNLETLSKAAVDYFQLGINKHLRLGQYLCNNYLKQGETWPELYYVESTRTAMDIAMAHLMEKSVDC